MTPSEKAACEDLINAYRQTLSTLDDVAAQLDYVPDDLDAKIKDGKTLANLAIADVMRFMEGSQK